MTDAPSESSLAADLASGLTGSGVLVAGREVPLWAGAISYAQTPPRAWKACLRGLKELGFTFVETWVPWALHETAPGKLSFAGPLDLGGFLDACADEALPVLLRVGPQVGGELNHGGLPDRIVRNPRMQAKSARGTPVVSIVPPRAFPAASYASKVFLDEVRAFYAAIAEVVAPRLSPRGPVAVLAVDHEISGFLRTGPYCADYHEDALVAWFERSGGRPPPRRFSATTPEELAPHLAWMAHRERQAQEALGALGRMLDEAGLAGVPRTHGYSLLGSALSDVCSTEAVVDAAGFTLQHDRRHRAQLEADARYLAGSSRLPFASQLATGTYPWGPPLRDAEARELLLRSLALGVRAFSAVMAVDRDRWIGALLDREGRPRAPLADVYRKTLAALAEAGFSGLERRADLAVVLPREYLHLDRCSSHLGPLGPLVGGFLGVGEAMAAEDDFGLAGPVQREQAEWRRALDRALRAARLPYSIIDGNAPLERLRSFRALVVPSFDFLSAGLIERLSAYADGGGRVLHGPRAPSRDAAMRQLPAAMQQAPLPGERLEAPLLSDPEALAAALARFAGSASCRRPASAREPDVDVEALERKDGGPALLFVGSRSDRARTATLDLGREARLHDPIDGGSFSGTAIEVPLPPGGTRLLVVE